LSTGKADTSVLALSNQLASRAFPTEEKVALQAALSLDQIMTNNHSLAAFKLAPDKADMSYHLGQTGLINSPLGIAAFNMGNTYDNAEGANRTNVVVGQTEETKVFDGRAVSEFVGLVGQSVNAGHVDLGVDLDKNLTYSFDRLILKEPKLRAEILANRKTILDSMDKLKEASVIEKLRQSYDNTIANGQATVDGNGASLEFLSQAYFVTKSLEIPGKPFRNFQLFLNINDLDGAMLDTLNINTEPAKTGTIQSLTYIEGMRQLALGLNMLAQSIVKDKKLMVVVMSEGGRSASLGDDKVSFGFVMGPGGDGGLKDALYANMDEINKAGSKVVKNPGSTSLAWNTDDLKSEKGLVLNRATKVGDLQAGVIEFLEEKTGKTGSRNGLSYVKLRRY